MTNGRPETDVITVDRAAICLSDSGAQVCSYPPLMKEDKNLQELIHGVINRQTQFILRNSYANALFKDFNKVSEWKSDLTAMKPGIHGRKWKLDSLCYHNRLSYSYWQQTGDTKPFDRSLETSHAAGS